MLRQRLYNLLRWSERHTKTDMVYLAKGGFWLTSSQVLSSFVSFGLAVAFAHWVTPTVYGQYKYVLSVAALLAIPTLSGIETATIRAVARGYQGTIFPALTTKLSWGLLGSLASIILGFYYIFINHNTSLGAGFILFSLIVSPLESFRLYQTYLSGQKKFKQLSFSLVATKIISASILLSSIFLTDNLLVILAAYFIPVALLRIFFWFQVKRLYPPNLAIDAEAIPYGKHLSLATIVSSVSDQLDSILLFNFLGPVQLAIFQFAIAPIETAKGILKHIQALALPKFSARTAEQIQKTIYKRLLLYMVFLSLIVLVYIPIAPFLYRLAFPAYTSAIGLSQLFSLSLLAAPLLLVVNTIFESQGMIKVLYKLRLINSLAQIIITISAVYFYGLLGAISARILFRFFSLGTSLVLLRQTRHHTEE